MVDFINITAIDIIDVLLVALLLFQLYRLIRGTNAISIFVGILMFYLLWIVVRLLGMELLSLILGQILGVGAIALIVVFQPEIRKFLFLIGDRYSKRKGGFWQRVLFGKVERSYGWVDSVISACVDMSQTKTGALIVIARNSDLHEFTDRGEIIDAGIGIHILESIFFKNSPLHDGAVVIAGERIAAARCILPVSNRSDIPVHFGTRHRAALGAAENSDAVVVVVSEERGHIAFVKGNQIFTNLGPARLRELLIEALEER